MTKTAKTKEVIKSAYKDIGRFIATPLKLSRDLLTTDGEWGTVSKVVGVISLPGTILATGVNLAFGAVGGFFITLGAAVAIPIAAVQDSRNPTPAHFPNPSNPPDNKAQSSVNTTSKQVFKKLETSSGKSIQHYSIDDKKENSIQISANTRDLVGNATSSDKAEASYAIPGNRF